MEGAAPSYVYFAIAQDGSFLIRHREGDKIDEMDKSLHYAIKKPDASGKSVNVLEVQVAPTAVSYLVNGAVVDATPTRAAIAGNSFTVAEKIGGIVGVRSDDQICLDPETLEQYDLTADGVAASRDHLHGADGRRQVAVRVPRAVRPRRAGASHRDMRERCKVAQGVARRMQVRCQLSVPDARADRHAL